MVSACNVTLPVSWVKYKAHFSVDAVGNRVNRRRDQVVIYVSQAVRGLWDCGLNLFHAKQNDG